MIEIVFVYVASMQQFKRDLDNILFVLTPWEMRIKKIESQ